MNQNTKSLSAALFIFIFFFSLLTGETYTINDNANNITYSIELPIHFAKGKDFHKTENLIFQCQTDYFLIYFSHARLDSRANLAETTRKLLEVIKEKLSSEGLKVLDLKKKEISLNGRVWIKFDYKAGKSADKKNSVHQVIYTTIDNEIMYMAIGTCLKFEREESKILRDVIKSLNVQRSVHAGVSTDLSPLLR